MIDSLRPFLDGADARGASRRSGATRKDRYRIESVIGGGSMGVVYRALDRVLGRSVALKTIRAELVSPERMFEEYKKRFYREARIFGSLSHPGVVTLYDVGESAKGVPFLTMEFVAGASLSALRRRGLQFSHGWTMVLMAQLASAIDYAHRHDVVHRDLKPSNILIGDGDEAKIADFGVAKLLGSEFTRSRTRCGTPGYMAPEQVLGKPADRSADLFSTAVVAFELLSGETPFPGEDVHAILYNVVHAEPIFPAGLRGLGLVPAKWTEIFARALHKDPSRRYPTASAFVSDLVELRPGAWLGELISKDPSSAPRNPGDRAEE